MPAVALGFAILLAIAGAEDDRCATFLEIKGTSATYRTPLFQGRPTRKDGIIDVEITSTATAPVGWIELGVFLGATLKSIEETRASALPTAKLRELEDGGVAFRAETNTLISPGSTRIVQIERTALPLARDFATVHAVIVGCRTLMSMGEVTIDTSGGGAEPAMPPVAWVAAGLAVVIALSLLILWLR